ncbi:MAG: serine/threonine-protein phosphatase [Clostridia bacterium]|nr:serine/threonine-protein phosphatase [Clostridia bacterium]
MFKRRIRENEQKTTSSVPRTESPEECKSPSFSLADGSVLMLGNAQHQGKRPYQEDSCGYSDLGNSELMNSKGILAVLADGMGGLANGKEVSSTLVSRLLELFNRPDTVCTGGADLYEWARRINDEICSRFCPDGSIKAGSTLVCALITGGILHWICVGDSRLYLKRNSRIYQVNEDHDYLNDLLSRAICGEISVDEAFSDPQKDVLVSCFGNEQMPRVDYSVSGFSLQSGDRLLLCSDGVYNAIPTELINQLLDKDPQTAAESIETAVLNQGFANQDNLTAIVISYEKGERI